MEDTLPANASLSELEDILGQTIDEPERDEGIEIPVHKAIAFGGSTEFWNAVDRFAARVEQSEMEANKIIAEQEKRKLIFQGQPTAQ